MQAAWEIDIWGKFRRGVESADAAYLSSIASYDDVLVTLLGDVATTYVGIRVLERQIAIAQANGGQNLSGFRSAGHEAALIGALWPGNARISAVTSALHRPI